MKNLYFLRHGESEFNKSLTWAGSTDTPLTPLGKLQAKKAGKEARSNGIKPDLIISSTLSRAIETAQIFARQLDYPKDRILYDKTTIERNFGELEGHKDKVAATRYIENESAIDDYPGVETLAELQSRADKFWHKLKSMPEETIIVVGHGAFLRALRRSVLKKPVTKRGQVFLNAELHKII